MVRKSHPLIARYLLGDDQLGLAAGSVPGSAGRYMFARVVHVLVPQVFGKREGKALCGALATPRHRVRESSFLAGPVDGVCEKCARLEQHAR